MYRHQHWQYLLNLTCHQAQQQKCLQHKQVTLVTGSCTVNGIDQSYTELSEIALKPYQASVELDASSFTHEIDYAACPMCRLLPDAAIESRCCRQLFCLPCIWHWLNGAAAYPSCRAHMSTSFLVAPHPFAAKAFAAMEIHCDFTNHPFWVAEHYSVAISANACPGLSAQSRY